MSHSWNPPRIIARYRIERSIGRGGMGSVYLATDTVFGRHVALKIVAREQVHERDLSPFRAEAWALAGLHHPNIAELYSIGIVDDRPYLVYEYIHGLTAAALSEKPSWRRAISAALGLARGLSAVHRAGILHRDVKPANVVIRADGVAKLIDFGLAKLVGRVARPRTTLPAEIYPTKLRWRMSAASSSFLVGTPRYLAPELWSGAKPAVASDIFGLGLVAYELAAGAFKQQSAVNGVPGLVHHGGVPTDFAELVDRCTARFPDARPRNAATVVEQLEEIEDAFSILEAVAVEHRAASFLADPDRAEAIGLAVHEATAREPFGAHLPTSSSERRRKVADTIYALFEAGSGRLAASMLEGLGAVHVAYGVPVAALERYVQVVVEASVRVGSLSTEDARQWHVGASRLIEHLTSGARSADRIGPERD